MLYRGLCIGINAYPSMPLRNCVHDAEDMAVMLEKIFGFSRKNRAEVRLLCDARATARNIEERIEWLVKADRWVLFQSGHGAQISDRDGDELDRLDELYCPVDFDWNDKEHMLIDDDYAFFFGRMADHARGIFISDSCHSGDLLRGSETTTPGTPRSRRIKTIAPPADVAWRNRQAIECGIALRSMGSEAPAGVVAISACRPDQFAMDGSPGNGRGNGAFTWAFVKTLLANPLKPLYSVIKEVNRLLALNGYRQEPQIMGDGAEDPFFFCEG